jgi:hypothetical protein
VVTTHFASLLRGLSIHWGWCLVRVLGIGELGSVFARAFLKNNHPVYPITRATDIDELRSLIDPEFILVCTGEKVSPMVAGVGEIATPAFFRALVLSSALPEPPLITAPA